MKVVFEINRFQTFHNRSQYHNIVSFFFADIVTLFNLLSMEGRLPRGVS